MMPGETSPSPISRLADQFQKENLGDRGYNDSPFEQGKWEGTSLPAPSPPPSWLTAGAGPACHRARRARARRSRRNTSVGAFSAARG